MPVHTNLWVPVADVLDPNLKAMALEVLKGDESAYRPMLDCALENCRGGPKITPQYVEMLEDAMMEIKRVLVIKEPILGIQEIETSRVVDGYLAYFKCVQVAKSLNRQGLS